MNSIRSILHKYSLTLLALAIFMLLLAIYVQTLLPSTVGGDAGELQYSGPIQALTHPTGIPLYIMVGKVWDTLVPIGTVAYRMNLLAAVSGAVGGALMAWLSSRLYGRVIGVACGLTLALGATFWDQAVIADKYAFNTIWATGTIGLAMWWAKDRQQPHGDKLLYTLSLWYGISLLHHRTNIIFGLFLAIMVLWYERLTVFRRWQRSLICVALVFLPAAIVYPLYLPWLRDRHLSVSPWKPRTLDEWITWILDRHEAKEAFVVPGWQKQIENYLQTMAHDYTIPVMILALFGAILMIIRQPAVAQLVLISFILQGGLAANWRDNDRPFTYFLPSFILMIYAYGYALHEIWKYLNPLLPSPVDGGGSRWGSRSLVITAAAIIILLVPIYQFFNTYDLRYTEKYYGYALDPWRQTVKTADMGERLASGLDDLPENAILFADWEQISILWYYRMIDNTRRDVDMIYPIEKIFDYENTGRPLCLARHFPMPEKYHLTNYDALICIDEEISTTLPQRATPIGTELATPDGEPILELAGAWLNPPVIEQGSFAQLVISWRALAEIDADYSVSVRVLDQNWAEVWKYDIQHPVLGLYATSRWQEGEVVNDYYELDIKPEMPPGRYLWTVVVYRQLADGTFENLQNANGEHIIYGGTIDVVGR